MRFWKIAGLISLLASVLSSPYVGFAQLALPESKLAIGASASSQAVKPQASAHAEDWSKIGLVLSDMDPMSYASLGTQDTPTFTRELIRIQWRPNDPIDLYVIKPHGVEHPPVILYLYNFTGSIDRFRDDGWCKRATKDGFAAVGFTSAVSGERVRYRPMKEWFVSEMQEALGESTHDVSMILNYLARRNDVDMTSIGMWGQGSGGAVSILAAAADSRIQAVDVMNPWGDWPEWLKESVQVPEAERPNYVTEAFLAKIKGLDPVDYLPKLKLKGLRVQEAVTDLSTPKSVRAKFAASVPNPSALVVYDTDEAALKAWRISGLSGWLEDQIRPRPAAGTGTDAVLPEVVKNSAH